MPTSKPLRAWAAEAPQVVLDPHAAWHEPTRRAELLLRSAAAPTLDALAAAIEMRDPRRDEDWLAGWRAADAVVPAALAEAPDGFEPRLLAALEPELPDGAIVWLSSSMPVRDVEACFPQSPKRLRFLSNRGANGIDGVVSSAAGAALATGAPTWLLTGELALLHDIGGLFAARRAGADLHVICIDNRGGGIFDFLPVAQHADPALYEQHIATPAFPSELSDLVTTIRTDRRTNVKLHRELVERVAATLP
jgi:2-succinyl-5-enolpyruvyl-6-hydroxy-3-cyclohexene-1-carboxylate synthase